jgi:hypothetical protein
MRMGLLPESIIRACYLLTSFLITGIQVGEKSNKGGCWCSKADIGNAHGVLGEHHQPA